MSIHYESPSTGCFLGNYVSVKQSVKPPGVKGFDLSEIMTQHIFNAERVGIMRLKDEL